MNSFGFGFAQALYFTRSCLLLEVSAVWVVLPSLGNPRVGVSVGGTCPCFRIGVTLHNR